ncbi:MAG: hypothetical protein ACK45B_09500 [Limisphaerales bacterium]
MSWKERPTPSRLRCAGMVLLGLLLAGGLNAAELADFTTPLFSGAGNCAFCHDPWTPNDTRSGAPLATDWRATMMAHSFKDPLWQAVMAAEVRENPARQSLIEDKCQTCHAPLARTQARADGTTALAFAAARTSPLAGEGVGCTLCHQIQPANLGTPASFTGHYEIGTNRLIYGPYEDVVTRPMQRHVNYTPVHGAHTQDSALCGTCHTLFTPILDAAGNVAGEFAEQTPYLEWRNSDHARAGRHCQDCHMPRVEQPVKVSSRPPWLEPRAPFWKHQFVGGNAFMLTLLANNAKPLDANATPAQFQPLIAEARAQLQRAARLQVAGERANDTLTLRVEVENLTGHKFPTGHPYRRAWLHVRVRRANGRTLFESGAADKTGALPGLRDGFAPHYDVITRPDQVQIYQSVMADLEGNVTWSLLRGAAYYKDNRLPPRGFATTGPEAAHVAIAGEAAQDDNFHADASGRDTVTYLIPLRGESRPVQVEVELLYQAVPPESIARLRDAPGPEAATLRRLLARQPNRPEPVQRAALKL